jgi:hypothetical protein
MPRFRLRLDSAVVIALGQQNAGRWGSRGMKERSEVLCARFGCNSSEQRHGDYGDCACLSRIQKAGGTD